MADYNLIHFKLYSVTNGARLKSFSEIVMGFFWKSRSTIICVYFSSFLFYSLTCLKQSKITKKV